MDTHTRFGFYVLRNGICRLPFHNGILFTVCGHHKYIKLRVCQNTIYLLYFKKENIITGTPEIFGTLFLYL